MKLQTELTSGSHNARGLPPVMRRFLQQSAIWTFLCFATEFVCYKFLHLHYPYTYAAVPISSRFGDFKFWLGLLSPFHSKLYFHHDQRFMYPASVQVCYKFFSLAPWKIHGSFVTLRFIATILIASWVSLFAVGKALLRRGLTPRSTVLFLLGMYMFSFPLWFEVHQANMEFIVWVTVSAGLWSYWTGRLNIAAILFGTAAALKIFPFVFVGLFIAQKQYRHIAVAFLTACFVSIGSLWLVCPDIAYGAHQVQLGLDQFRQMYMLHLLPMESGFDHSLFCLLKRLMPTLPQPQQLGHILNVYLAVAAIGGTLTFFLRIRKLPLVNQVLCLTVASILLPPVSYDYTLLHLYAPFVLFLFVALRHGETGALPVRGLGLVFALFGFILSPQSEFIWHGIRYAGQLKAAVLSALFVLGVRFPFPYFEANSLGLRSAIFHPSPAETVQLGSGRQTGSITATPDRSAFLPLSTTKTDYDNAWSY